MDVVPTHNRFALVSEFVCPDSEANQDDNENSKMTVVQCNYHSKHHKVKLDDNTNSIFNVCRKKQSNTTVSDQKNLTEQTKLNSQLLKASSSHPVDHSTTHTSSSGVSESCMDTIPIYSAFNSNIKQKLFRNDSFEPEVLWSRDCQDNCVISDVNTHSIPQEVIDNKNTCKDYTNCIQQTGSHIGFTPLTTLQLYTGIE